MSRSEKTRAKQAVELVRKGATMLAEPCPQCGGVQVMFRGKVYCTSHEDLSGVLKEEAVSLATVVAQMREVLLVRLTQAASRLETEGDTEEQDKLVSLMAKLYELLEKLPRK